MIPGNWDVRASATGALGLKVSTPKTSHGITAVFAKSHGSTIHFILLAMNERGIGFRSISDGMIDTTSASGYLVLNIFSALTQFERRLIQERTNAGLAAARVVSVDAL